MSNFKDTVLKGLYYKYLGERQLILAELNVLLDSPVGVGDHAVQSKDVDEKIQALEKITSLIDTIVEEFEPIVTDPRPFIPDIECPEHQPAGGTPGPVDMGVDGQTPLGDPGDSLEDCDDGKCGC